MGSASEGETFCPSPLCPFFLFVSPCGPFLEEFVSLCSLHLEEFVLCLEEFVSPSGPRLEEFVVGLEEFVVRLRAFVSPYGPCLGAFSAQERMCSQVWWRQVSSGWSRGLPEAMERSSVPPVCRWLVCRSWRSDLVRREMETEVTKVVGTIDISISVCET